jgi:transcriptional regulator with XRE-family HTH domain
MDLALEVGVSPRHLSFVETGRSRPSPELVLAIATHLDVPLRERNTLLLAAGYAPRYSQSAFDDPSMVLARASLQRMLDAHDPYPGVVVDRLWNVVLANSAAAGLTAGMPDELLELPMNVYRVSLHPDGLAARTSNFAEWAPPLLRQLRRSVVLTGDPALEALLVEVEDYPTVSTVLDGPEATEWDDPPLLIPMRIEVGGVELSLFTTITTFGTPRDVTLDELALELFFPADADTERVLRGDRELVGVTQP